LKGFAIHAITSAQTLDTIVRASRAGRGGWVLTPNLDILRRIATESETRTLCEATTLRVADGMPLVWASKLQRTPLPQRVTGSDMILSLNERAAKEGLSVYLLGGDPGIADQAKSSLLARFPTLRIVGAESPPYGFDKDEPYMQAMMQRVCEASPDIVFVAVGFPKQERVIARLRPLLPKAWFLGVGISFSFVTGDVRRAPRWMQRVGLEWSHRLLQEPKRLFRRYLIDGLPFAIRLWIGSALGGGKA
jgi:N-acetylglucosaminyldiphosphoundecaprenol N-acetyl-beta-D-mannosaminyltransferase